MSALHRRATWLTGGLLCALAALCVGCGGYASSTASARRALLKGDAQSSLSELEQALEQAPDSHLPLLHLERAISRHQSGDLEGASRDYQRGDEALELLDYTSATAQEVAAYLYSDDSAPYRPAPYEKALINLLNLMSYLERGDAAGARVEARRFAVYRDYFEAQVSAGEERAAAVAPLMTLGAALGAYAHLSAGDSQGATRWAASAPVVKERVSALLSAQLPGEGAPQRAQLLVLSMRGLIAYKSPVRLGLGRAMIYLSAHPGHGLSASEHRALQRRAANAAVKWLNFVELVQPQLRSAHGGSLLGLPTTPLPLHSVNLSALARDAFELAQPKMLAASLTRLLSRALIGQGSQRLARRQLGPLGSLLVGLAVEGGMSAADTPDTRSWSSLPEQLELYWLSLPPGHYELMSGAPHSQAVPLELKPGGLHALTLPRWAQPTTPSQESTP